ncbi:hypothetical protein [Bradyrhizobium canariense]|uniref:hypothetical protein n=1 Tax=Bradyrhizobium canariense TaxID=255045 RepID=UPI000A1971AE|nr:hypothetical protein [Bradyrhizobium canariense]OSI24807.1 hypothetical protein BST65_16695 [Bradyrhizobium canariense]OSI33268.1 hypothetical protein BST66_14135 [Bradyrhizobium canariense]OSI48069.1 hypothetical protein BSZ20_08005 [Bradyrhizobium canariense]OSI48635.1 hypothetical protein BST67_18395 [Bradyrhizobium canariense]OSI58593.1 hypothetical protein BSZ15_08805 [Bradyrhizobium canariense]
MGGKKKTMKRGLRTPIGERVSVLMMIDPQIAADIKAVALEEKRAAWSVMEEAARDYLKRRKQKRAKRKSAVAEPTAS